MKEENAPFWPTFFRDLGFTKTVCCCDLRWHGTARHGTYDVVSSETTKPPHVTKAMPVSIAVVSSDSGFQVEFPMSEQTTWCRPKHRRKTTGTFSLPVLSPETPDGNGGPNTTDTLIRVALIQLTRLTNLTMRRGMMGEVSLGASEPALSRASRLTSSTVGCLAATGGGFCLFLLDLHA